jgi:hypothetical protein
LRSNILNNGIHPVRYLLADGICHALQSDAPFSPSLFQFSPQFQGMALEALSTQQSMGWDKSLKGYFEKNGA